MSLFQNYNNSRNVCLMNLLGVLSGKKITVPTYVVTAISFFKEAAFAASPNPSSILLGIHFCIYSVMER